jgi:cell division protease FtsH
MRYGMSQRLGPISYDSSGHSIFIGRDFGQTKSYSEETAGIIDEEVKAIFDKASEICTQILTEHADQVRDIAEYLLVNETMEAEEFNYYFEHGEFMPISPKDVRKAQHDDTIERPARKISMTDGYAEEQKAQEQADSQTETKSDTATATQSQEDKDKE